MSKYKVSIVIPNWNGKEKLEKNLPKILQKQDIDETIVVDDCSTDDSASFIKANFPQVKLIEKNKNSGFSSTVNLGVATSSGDLVFLLNSDANVENKDCLEYILPHFDDPKIFSVGCNTGGSWSWAKFEKGYIWHFLVKDIPVTAHQTLWVSGGSGIFRKSIWNELGGMDEMFDPFYEEDFDLGYRVTKRGYINLWEPKAKVSHEKETGVISLNFSKKFISKIAQRNQLLFLWKNLTDAKLFNEHRIQLLRNLTLHPTYFSTVISTLTRLPQILEKREIEKKEAILSDLEILEKYSQD